MARNIWIWKKSLHPSYHRTNGCGDQDLLIGTYAWAYYDPHEGEGMMNYDYLGGI